MKRTIKLFGLVVIFSAMIMLLACEIGESPMELARKQREHVQKPSVQTVKPTISNQPTAPEQAMPAESATATEAAKPGEPTKPAKPEPPSQESLGQIKAWVVVDVDNGQLRSAPDADAEVVREVPFATVLLVLEKKASWYKVALPDKKTLGWVQGEDVHESNMSPDQFQPDDLANFYYAVSTTMKDEAKRARLLELLIEQYPQSMIYFKDPDTKMVIQGSAKELALFSFADIYKADREYQKAIDAYDTIIDEARRTGVKGYAEWNLLKIYKNNLKDTRKTIDQALHIVDTYEKVSLTGYEWNIWVDLSAAETLRDTLNSMGASGSDLVRYGQKVVAANNYPPVQIIGSIIIAEGDRKQNNRAAMENTILEILKKHPTSPVQYYRKTVDYSTEALSFVVKYYIEELHDYEAAIAFSQKVVASMSNKTLANNAKFALAYISDIWHADRGEVIAAYQDCGNVSDFLYANAFPTSDARLQAIQRFEPFSGTVVVNGASARLEPEASSAVVISLAKDDKLMVFYGNPPNFRGRWLKVRTQDERIGWVQEEILAKDDVLIQRN